MFLFNVSPHNLLSGFSFNPEIGVIVIVGTPHTDIRHVGQFHERLSLHTLGVYPEEINVFHLVQHEGRPYLRAEVMDIYVGKPDIFGMPYKKTIGRHDAHFRRFGIHLDVFGYLLGDLRECRIHYREPAVVIDQFVHTDSEAIRKQLPIDRIPVDGENMVCGKLENTEMSLCMLGMATFHASDQTDKQEGVSVQSIRYVYPIHAFSSFFVKIESIGPVQPIFRYMDDADIQRSVVFR